MFVLFWISSALGATWTVAPTGASFDSIQDAIDASTSGDTIQVASGTYAESLNLGGRSLTITATSGASSTFLTTSGTQTSVQWTQSENGTLRRIHNPADKKVAHSTLKAARLSFKIVL